MDIIRIKNMQFYGYHGVNESEKEQGGQFEVDVEMSTDLNEACTSDNFETTIDYEAVFQTVENCVKGNKFNLIEALAESIANAILMQFNIAKITVRVRKPEAPIDGNLDTVEVEITRQKDDNA